jgi:hypothetical protein
MTSQKQNEANRRNAQRSTGPRTDTGKARAALNRVKHGIYAKSQIIPGEDLAQREALEAAYMERFAPETIEQLHLVKILIDLDWEDARLVKADAQLWTYGVNNAYKPQPDTVLGKAFMNHNRTFNILGRRRDANQRRYLITLRELQSLQSIPLPDDPDAAEQPDPGPQAPPEAPDPAPQPVETAPAMGSNPHNPTRPQGPLQGNGHPNPRHLPIDECPNCSVPGYPSPSCDSVARSDTRNHQAG